MVACCGGAESRSAVVERDPQPCARAGLASAETLNVRCLHARPLTPDGKSAVLREWAETVQQWRIGALSGVGEPDTDMIEWCDRINSLPGICTLQSCAGHKRGDIIESAHLWLWLSERAQARFDARAHRLLAATDLIDWISVHHQADGKKVASITFYGNERGLLRESASAIYGFLCGIADAA